MCSRSYLCFLLLCSLVGVLALLCVCSALSPLSVVQPFMKSNILSIVQLVCQQTDRALSAVPATPASQVRDLPPVMHASPAQPHRTMAVAETTSLPAAPSASPEVPTTGQ